MDTVLEMLYVIELNAASFGEARFRPVDSGVAGAPSVRRGTARPGVRVLDHAGRHRTGEENLTGDELGRSPSCRAGRVQGPARIGALMADVYKNPGLLTYTCLVDFTPAGGGGLMLRVSLTTGWDKLEGRTQSSGTSRFGDHRMDQVGLDDAELGDDGLTTWVLRL